MNLLEQLIAITKLIPGHVAECLRGESPVRPSAEIEYCGACGHPWHGEGDGRCAGGSATARPGSRFSATAPTDHAVGAGRAGCGRPVAEARGWCRAGLHRWRRDTDVYHRKICKRCGAGRWTR
jgi:hypothetical protein